MVKAGARICRNAYDRRSAPVVCPSSHRTYPVPPGSLCSRTYSRIPDMGRFILSRLRRPARPRPARVPAGAGVVARAWRRSGRPAPGRRPRLLPRPSRFDKATKRHAEKDSLECGVRLVAEPSEEADAVFADEHCPEAMWFTAGNHEDYELVEGVGARRRRRGGQLRGRCLRQAALRPRRPRRRAAGRAARRGPVGHRRPAPRVPASGSRRAAGSAVAARRR